MPVANTQMQIDDALSLYVHVPWCVRKCPYCDFNSHKAPEVLPETDYLAALLEDFDTEWRQIDGRTIDTIFIGGGTPSLFQPETYEKLLRHIASNALLSDNAEITLEANPGTFELERFRGYRDAGINRLSIGIQSFNDTLLQQLGRIHRADEAKIAAGEAREIFNQLNLDLMHGLPGQTPEQALEDLQQAINLQPDQISWYQLTIEPNTEFYSKPPTLPVEEDLWEIQEQGQKLLDSAGYRQYEISAYAKPGGQARHNLNYWSFGDYLGIGAGAHGKLSTSSDTGLLIERVHKQRQPKGYMARESRVAGRSQIAPEDLPFEFMLNALRLNAGLPISRFTQTTGLSDETIQKHVREAVGKGLLEEKSGWLQPTQSGRLFLNDLLTIFME